MGMKIKDIIKDPKKMLYLLGMKGMLGFIPDRPYLKLMFWANTGKHLELDNPKTYNDKLQWLKLNDRNPDYTRMVDKYEAKEYIASIVGKEYIIPTLGVWDTFDEIDFSKLPDRFILKCTHDSGGLIICKDKSKLDIGAARKKIVKCLKRNYFVVGREYPYKNVKPRIIAEQYMENHSANEECLTDYKFFCFEGIPKVVYISKDKAKEPRTDFFDMSFNHLPIRMRDKNSDVLPDIPEKFDEMKRIASKLSKGFKHLRIDFYQIDGNIFVGELTFYHNSGFSLVNPPEWNKKMGEWINV